MSVALDIITGASVDLSNLSDMDLDMVDSVEFITYREAKDILGKDENVSITNGDDLKPYAYGIARPVSDAYAAMRRNGKALLLRSSSRYRGGRTRLV